nr:6-phosphofructo-2-kinase/fructose-2,6-bisphosphatase-like [Leptinotarsa decemlineata]
MEVCDDPKIIEQNIMEVKVSSPDYVNMNKDAALADFLQRILHYQERYSPLDEEREKNVSFMKIYNTGEKVVVHKHEGHVQARIVYYLMNIHITPRTIYLTRHGESEQNLLGRIGGDSNLSARGRQYANALAAYIQDQKINGLRIWTSWLKRTIQTVAGLQVPQERWKSLNEIDALLSQVFRSAFAVPQKGSRPMGKHRAPRASESASSLPLCPVRPGTQANDSLF